MIAAAATARLIQLKQQAKRFTAWEVVEGERCELRLMPSPIERYTPGDADRADAAVTAGSSSPEPKACRPVRDGTGELRLSVEVECRVDRLC